MSRSGRFTLTAALLGAAIGLAATASFAGGSQKNASADRSVYSDKWSSEYDHLFRKYSKRYFGPYFDWRWFKAQAVAESGLKPEAKSHVGAKGLMQIMPATYSEIKSRNPYFEKLEDPRWNIAAGIYYNRHLYRYWPEAVGNDRVFFTFGSYNAGLGNIIKAVNRAGREQPRAWDIVAPYAPSETRAYVERIIELKDAQAYKLAERQRLKERRFDR